MSRKLGVAGIQMHVARGEDNTEAMLKKVEYRCGSFSLGGYHIFQRTLHKRPGHESGHADSQSDTGPNH